MMFNSTHEQLMEEATKELRAEIVRLREESNALDRAAVKYKQQRDEAEGAMLVAQAALGTLRDARAKSNANLVRGAKARATVVVGEA